MVSPPAKNGGDVLLDTGRIRAAESEDGLPMATMFSSRTGFGDVAGGANATDYLSQRTLAPGTTGWTTHGVFPAQSAIGIFASIFGGEALYMAEASPDLTRAGFRSYSSLPGTPEEVFDNTNLYARLDLRSPGSGQYQLLSVCTFACSVEVDEFGGGGSFIAASTDFGRTVFVNEDRLTSDAPASGQPLYKSIGGVPEILGYVPPPPATACTGTASSCEVASGAVLGAGNRTYVSHALSDDGTRAFFTANSNVYMRDDRGTQSTDDDVTVQVNASERTAPAASQGGTYWQATPAGDRAFFVSGEALTDDALPTAGNLYRWSVTPDGDGHRLAFLSADSEPADAPGEVLGTLGISRDGTRAYFLQRGQLVAGEPVLGSRVGIYLWRQNGGIRYLGEMVDPADVRGDLGGSQHAYDEMDQLGARVTPDGAHLLISLRQPPEPGGFDHGNCPDDEGTFIEGKRGCRQLYLYATAPDTFTCVSCRPGAGGASAPAFYSVWGERGTTLTASHLNNPLSDDGGYVFFSTSQRLVAADTNGVSDAYVFDAASGSAALLSGGESKAPSYFVDASRDGRDAFLATRQRLSEWDVDSNLDLYDARVDGGVPEPVSGPSACDGDACQPPPTALALSAPATVPKPRRATARPARCAKRHSRRAAARKGAVTRRCTRKRGGKR